LNENNINKNYCLNNNKKYLKINHLIFDLENTILLNQEIIMNLLLTIKNLNQKEKKILCEKFEKIMKNFKKKMNIKKEINKINSKILINKQIIEENKKNINENYIYFEDQMNEINQNINKKSSLIKTFKKKFIEVEIYIQRECKNYEKFSFWENFSINFFMNKNEKFLKEKEYFNYKILNLKKRINFLIEENNFIKQPIFNISNCYLKIIDFYNDKNLLFERKKEFFNFFLKKLCENLEKKEKIPSFIKILKFQIEKDCSLNSLNDKSILKKESFKDENKIFKISSINFDKNNNEINDLITVENDEIYNWEISQNE
jgi:hypothetical protein